MTVSLPNGRQSCQVSVTHLSSAIPIPKSAIDSVAPAPDAGIVEAIILVIE